MSSQQRRAVLQEPPSWVRPLSLAVISSILAIMVLGVVLQSCPCTVFAWMSTLAALHCGLLAGNTSYAALTVEREKKTLDSLRLTSLSNAEILWYKARPDVQAVVLTWLGWLPAMLLAGLRTDLPLIQVCAAALVGLVGGAFGIAWALLVSSLAATTSQAIVAGWVTKGVWLLLLPLLDFVVSAVTVDQLRLPLFASLDPLAMVVLANAPEASPGGSQWLPLVWCVAHVLAFAAVLGVTLRRLEHGLVADGGVKDRAVHAIYDRSRKPWWLVGPLASLHGNPSFLRELAAQLRAGAGRWPGVAVFVVLFYAPTLYSDAWNQRAEQSQQAPSALISRAAVETTLTDSPSTTTLLPGTSPSPTTSTFLRIDSETRLELVGHKPSGCFRMFLLRTAGVPLPARSLRYYEVKHTYVPPTGSASAGSYQEGLTQVAAPSARVAAALGLAPAAATSAGLDGTAAASSLQRSLRQGMMGSVVLLMLYLSIRCSAFVATVISGEKARCTWEDLVLSGVSVSEVMTGKAAAVICLPLLQMLIAFPMMAGFVHLGVLTAPEVALLATYAVSVVIVTAALGLYGSAASTSSHGAHLFALARLLPALLMLPVATGLGFFGVIPFVVAVVACVASRSRSAQACWLAVAFLVLLAPAAASPLTAALWMLPSLLPQAEGGLALMPALGVCAGSVAVNLLVARAYWLEAGRLLSGVQGDDVMDAAYSEARGVVATPVS